MINLNFLQMMYQQWSDGQSDVASRWVDFIEFAAKHTNDSQDAIRQALQKTYWFQWRREE
jgi:hypothetical protein